MSVRLVAGGLRGRRIEVPPGVRPTENRVREALFSIWRDRISGASFLDLFAGSGAVGLEAWGLGASRIVFVEERARVLAVLRQTCRKLGSSAETARGHLPELLKRRGLGSFDLVFADPPYAFQRYEELIEATAAILGASGEIVVEHSARKEVAEQASGAFCVDRRRYGESCLSFYRPLIRG